MSALLVLPAPTPTLGPKPVSVQQTEVRGVGGGGVPFCIHLTHA